MTKTLFLTRDRCEGSLSDIVEAWTLVPDRIEMQDGDVMWVAPLDTVDRRSTLVSSWSLLVALAKFKGDVPSSAVECRRVGSWQ